MKSGTTNERTALIDEMIATGRFNDADEVIDEALRHLAEHERKLGQLRSKLAHAMEQAARGDTVTFTEKWRADRLRIAKERAAAGDIPNPDVCP